MDVMKKNILSFFCSFMGMMSFSAYAGDVSFFADLLQWHASEETASIWSSQITEPQPNETVFTPKNVDFDWNQGVRMGFLYHPTTQFWDTSLAWTHYSTDYTLNNPVGDQIVTPEFFSGFLSGNLFFGANLDWQLQMNQIDLSLSHAFNIGKSFQVRPSMGIKSAWIDQTIKNKWYADVYTSTEKVENNFYGVGPSAGIDVNWTVYKNVSLLSDLSTAFLFGHWDVKDTYKRPSALNNLVTPTTITTRMSDAQLGTPMLDYFLGFQWRHEGRAEVGVKLGYEMQFWSNQLRAVTFQQLPMHGDLTLQGATCGIYVQV
jgi:hypothetical protein